MSAEANKAIVRRFYEEVFSQGNLSALSEITAADYVNHDPSSPPGGWPPGIEGLGMVVGTYRAAFPDVQFTVDDQIAEGDKVVTRWSARGTNRGPLMGMPPGGRSIVITGISIERIAGGKMAETWVNFDGLGMLQQLGVVPAPGQAG
jgi:predicted ester cyclase